MAEATGQIVPLTIKGSTAVVHLTKGQNAIVDLADWQYISAFRWCRAIPAGTTPRRIASTTRI